MNEAYAITDEHGMWLCKLPATFGHYPPVLFKTAREAALARSAADKKIVVIEWVAKEVIG